MAISTDVSTCEKIVCVFVTGIYIKLLNERRNGIGAVCLKMTTYVAPSKFDTVLSIPESGMSLHSISYEM